MTTQTQEPASVFLAEHMIKDILEIFVTKNVELNDVDIEVVYLVDIDGVETRVKVYPTSLTQLERLPLVTKSSRITYYDLDLTKMERNLVDAGTVSAMIKKESAQEHSTFFMAEHMIKDWEFLSEQDRIQLKTYMCSALPNLECAHLVLYYRVNLEEWNSIEV